MFNLRNFIKNGLMQAVGHMANYQVILNAAGWHEKGVLTESDLADIHDKINGRKKTEIVEDGLVDTTAPDGEDEPVVEEAVEETVVEEP